MSRLAGIVEGCLVADAAARWTVSRVIGALAALRREVGSDVATTRGGGCGRRIGGATGGVMSSSSVASSPPTGPLPVTFTAAASLVSPGSSIPSAGDVVCIDSTSCALAGCASRP